MSTATKPERTIGERLGDVIASKPAEPAPAPPPTPEQEEQGKVWATDLTSFLRDFTHPAERIKDVPKGCPLSALLDVGDALKLDSRDLEPAISAADRLATRLHGQFTLEDLNSHLKAVLFQLERAIAARLQEGQEDSRVIPSSIFKTGGLTTIGTGSFTTTGSSVWLAVGQLSYLNPDDPRSTRVKTLLPEDQCYRIESHRPDGGFAGLILGPADERGRPRPWYTVESAIINTKAQRKLQLLKSDEEKEKERLELEQRKRDAESTPIGQHQRLAREAMAREREDLAYQIKRAEQDADFSVDELAELQLQLSFMDRQLGLKTVRAGKPAAPAVLSGSSARRDLVAMLRSQGRDAEADRIEAGESVVTATEPKAE